MIDEAVLHRALNAALEAGGEFAEVFVEDRRSGSVKLEDGRVEELSSGRARGAGIRVISGQTTGFAHTTDLTETGLTAAARAASGVARGGSGGGAAALRRESGSGAHAAVVAPETVPKASKVALLRQADDAARAEGGQISQVTATYAENRRRFVVANSEGVLASDDQVRLRFGVSAVARGDQGLQTGVVAVGRTDGFELFDHVDVEDMGRTAARKAIKKLEARPAPSGSLPVVIAAGGGAVLFHEACGHPLEADIIAKGASVFCGKVGRRVAPEHVTLVDDGSIGGEWGYFSVDDEGRPAQRNVLIDKGILTDYMWDFLRSRNEGRVPSGNGRRQTYHHLPMVRMSNTFLEDGTDDPEELIAATQRGVYIAQLGGGQVNPASGDFVFGMREAYMIERGQLTYQIRDANLIGNGADVLTKIDGVAGDFAMAPGGGMCGKDGQSVPVGMGQPTLRVSSITIGGTARA